MLGASPNNQKKKKKKKQVFSLFFRLPNLNQANKLPAPPTAWAGAKQSRSPGAEHPTQARVHQPPVGADGPASTNLSPVGPPSHWNRTIKHPLPPLGCRTSTKQTNCQFPRLSGPAPSNPGLQEPNNQPRHGFTNHPWALTAQPASPGWPDHQRPRATDRPASEPDAQLPETQTARRQPKQSSIFSFL